MLSLQRTLPFGSLLNDPRLEWKVRYSFNYWQLNDESGGRAINVGLSGSSWRYSVRFAGTCRLQLHRSGKSFMIKKVVMWAAGYGSRR
jgi:hypothetical protein